MNTTSHHLMRDMGECGECSWAQECNQESGSCTVSVTLIYWITICSVIVVVFLTFQAARSHKLPLLMDRLAEQSNMKKNQKAKSSFYEIDLQSLSHSLEFSNSMVTRV